LVVAGWIVCLGRRTISRIWQTLGHDESDDHSSIYRLFNQAVWNWDEIARIFLVELLVDLIPGTTLWLITDDTLCHKRGARVAFGGMFLDAVLSSKKHKVFRHGVNWVTLGLAIQLPCRKDRYFCINLLWRAYSKEVKGLPHKTKPQLAREMLDLVALWLSDHTLYVLADSAYMGKHLLKGLPDHVHVVGPIHPKASLSHPLPADYAGRRKKGDKLSNPTEMMTNVEFVEWDDMRLTLPNGQRKKLEIRVSKGLCWYTVLGQRKIQVVLVRDTQKSGKGKWRDEYLFSTDLSLSPEEMILGYMKRWSVEVAYCDAKQMLGFHDAMVWSEKAVERAHPMAWFVGGLVLLWYAKDGVNEEQAERPAPWYTDKKGPSFADMLATLRLYLWRAWYDSRTPAEQIQALRWLFHYIATATG
jgi:hypothetical protein